MRPASDVSLFHPFVSPPQYVRLQTMRGEDFAFVLVCTCSSLYSIRVLTIFDTLMYYLKAKFAIDVCAGDLTFDLPRNAPVSASYTLLDVLFVCILSCDFDTFSCPFFDEGFSLEILTRAIAVTNVALWFSCPFFDEGFSLEILTRAIAVTNVALWLEVAVECIL